MSSDINNDKSNITIVGQGAMGLLWYHNLAIAGENVAMLSTTARSYKNKGETESESKSKTESESYSFTDIHGKKTQGILKKIDESKIASASIILVCVKSYQVHNALMSISGNLSASTNIILAHNGIGTLSELPETLKNNHCVLALLTTHGAFRSKQNTITHTGIGISDIGVIAGELPTKRQQHALTNMLNKALPSVQFHQNINVKRWQKLAINCVINPLTALNNIDNGVINDSKYQRNINNILKEVVKVAQAENVSLNYPQLIEKVTQVAQATAKNSSSMRCDLLAGRKTEIDYINGYIHHLGLKHNIATPENTCLWQKLK